MSTLARSVLAIVLLALVAVGCAAPAPTPTSTAAPKPAAQPTATAVQPTPTVKAVTMKVTTFQPETHFISRGLKLYVEKASQYSNGSLKFEVFYGASLFNEAQTVDAVSTRSADMGVLQLHRWTSYFPAADIFNVAFLFKDFDHIDRWIKAGGQDLVFKEQEKKNITPLGWMWITGTDLFGNTKRPLKKPEDLQGLKIRAPAPMTAAAVDAFGAKSVVVPIGDAYLGLQTGTVDGAVSVASSFIEWKWTEVIKYATQMQFLAAVPHNLLINTDVWKSLAPSQQDALKKAMADYSKFSRDEALADIQKAYSELKKVPSIEYYVVPDSDLPVWAKAAEPVVSQYLKAAGDLGKQFVDLASKTRQ